MKNSLEWHKDKCKQAEKLPVNLKSLSNRKKKIKEMWTEPKAFVRHHQVDQHTHWRLFDSRKEKESFLQWYNDRTFPKYDKNINVNK